MKQSDWQWSWSGNLMIYTWYNGDISKTEWYCRPLWKPWWAEHICKKRGRVGIGDSINIGQTSAWVMVTFLVTARTAVWKKNKWCSKIHLGMFLDFRCQIMKGESREISWILEVEAEVGKAEIRLCSFLLLARYIKVREHMEMNLKLR